MPKVLGLPINPDKLTKLAALQRVSPFCYGFLRYELTSGTTSDELQEAIVKSASLDDSIASVWNDFFEKVGAGIFSAPGTGAATPVPTLKPPTPALPIPTPHPAIQPRPQAPQADPGTATDYQRETLNRPLPAYTPRPQLAANPAETFSRQHQRFINEAQPAEAKPGDRTWGQDALGALIGHGKAVGSPLWEQWGQYSPQQRSQIMSKLQYPQLNTLRDVYGRLQQPVPQEIANEINTRQSRADELTRAYARYQQGGWRREGNELVDENDSHTRMPWNPAFEQLDKGRQQYLQNLRPQLENYYSQPGVRSAIENVTGKPVTDWNQWVHERYPLAYPNETQNIRNNVMLHGGGSLWSGQADLGQSGERGLFPRYQVRTTVDPDQNTRYELAATPQAEQSVSLLQGTNPQQFNQIAQALGASPNTPFRNWTPSQQDGLLRLLSEQNLWQRGGDYNDIQNPSAIQQVLRAAGEIAPHPGAGRLLQPALGAAARLLPSAATEAVAPVAEQTAAKVAPEVAATIPKAYNPALGMAQGLGAEAAPAIAPAAEAATGTGAGVATSATEAAASRPWWRTLLDPYKAPPAPKLTGADRFLPTVKVPYTSMPGTRPTNLSSYGLEQAVQNTLERAGVRNIWAKPIMGTLRSATIPWRVASGEGAFVNALRGNSARAMGYGAAQGTLPLVAAKVGDPREASQANPANVLTWQGFPGSSVPAGVIGTIGEAVDPGTGWMPKGTPTIGHYIANNLRNVGVIGRWLKDLPNNTFAQKNVAQFAKMIPSEAPGSIKGFTQGQMGGSPSGEAGQAIAEINKANQIIENPESSPAAKQNSIEEREKWKAVLAPLQKQYAGRWGNDLTNFVPTMFAIDNLKALQQKLTAQGAPKEQLDRVNAQLAAQQGHLSNYQISDIEMQRLRNYQDQVREALKVVGPKPLTPEEQAGNFGQPATALQGLTAPLTTAASLLGSAGSAMSRLYGIQTGSEPAGQEDALRRAALHAFERFGFKDPRAGMMAPTFLGNDAQGQPITEQQQLLQGMPGQATAQPTAPAAPAVPTPTPGAPAAPATAKPAGPATAAPATAQQKTPPPSQVQQGLAARIQQMPEGEQKQKAQALYQWTHEAGNAGLQKAKSLGYDNLEDTNQWNRFVNDPTVRQEAAKNLTNDPTFQQKFPNMDPEKALGVSLGIWDRMNDTQKWFLFGGLGIAALGLLTSMFSSDDDDEEGGGMGLFGPALGLGGLAAAGYGISGGHPSRLLNPSFYRSQTMVS